MSFWRRSKKEDGTPVFVFNRRAAVLAFVFLALAAWIAGGGAAQLSDDPWVKWVLVVLSVSAVLYESVALVLSRHAKSRQDWTSVWSARGLLVIAIVYSAGMQYNYLGPRLMAPSFEDQASAGAIVVLDQRIATLEARRKALPAVPGTPDSLSWLIDRYEQDKAKAGNKAEAKAAQTKLTQANADMAIAKSVVDLDTQIKNLNDERIKLLGRPPSDTKALLAAFVSMDPRLMNLLWILLGMVFLQLTNVFMSRIRGLDYLQLAAAVPKPETSVKPETPPISDKGGGSTGNKPPVADKPSATHLRIVQAAGNGLDRDASATELTHVRETYVSHVSHEPVGTSLVPVSGVSLPACAEFFGSHLRPAEAQETYVSELPKTPRREKQSHRERYQQAYADFEQIVSDAGMIPTVRETQLLMRKLGRGVSTELTCQVMKDWSARNEDGDDLETGTPPMRRQKLGKSLKHLAGKYKPQIDKIHNGRNGSAHV